VGAHGILPGGTRSPTTSGAVGVLAGVHEEVVVDGGIGGQHHVARRHGVPRAVATRPGWSEVTRVFSYRRPPRRTNASARPLRYLRCAAPGRHQAGGHQKWTPGRLDAGGNAQGSPRQGSSRQRDTRQGSPRQGGPRQRDTRQGDTRQRDTRQRDTRQRNWGCGVGS